MVFLIIIHHCFAIGSQPSSRCFLLSWPPYTALTDFYSALEFNSLDPPMFTSGKEMAQPYYCTSPRSFHKLVNTQRQKTQWSSVSLKWTLKWAFKKKSFTLAFVFYSLKAESEAVWWWQHYHIQQVLSAKKENQMKWKGDLTNPDSFSLGGWMLSSFT